MCEKARAPPPDSTMPDGAAGQAPGEAGEVRVELVGAQHVGLDRIERGGHAGEGAGAGGDVVGDEVAPAQLVRGSRPPRERAAGRDAPGSGRPAGGRSRSSRRRPVRRRRRAPRGRAAASARSSSGPYRPPARCRWPPRARRWSRAARRPGGARAASARPEAMAPDGSPRSSGQDGDGGGTRARRRARCTRICAQLLGQRAGERERRAPAPSRSSCLEVVAVDRRGGRWCAPPGPTPRAARR